MRDALLGGILIMLAVIAALLFHVGWSQVKEKDNRPNISNLRKLTDKKFRSFEDSLSISSLKKAEKEIVGRYHQPKRDGKINMRAIEAYDLQTTGGLARQDVSEFFKKDVPLDQPNLPISYFLTWAALAVSDAMVFGFNDYKMRLSLASDYFTEDGWKNFSDALKRSRLIEMVEVNQQIITAAPKGAPILQSQGVVGGRYQWVVEIPLILTYRSGAKTSNVGLLVTAIIVRSDDPKHSYGIGIDKWIAMAR